MDLYNPTIFKDRLSKLIASKGKSQRGFATDADIQPSTLNRYLNTDRIPDLSEVLKICNVCNVSLDWIFGRQEEPRGVAPEMLELVQAYTLASASDRAIVDALLQKYKNL